MTAQEITAHDLVGFDDLRLLASASSPCITIVLPLPDPLEIPVRLKNAIRSVTTKLEVIKPQSSDTLLEPVRELARTTETQGVWSNGLIVFRSPDVFRYYFLHQPVPELHAVEERFQIRPLLSAFAREQRFHLLGLSRRDVRLFHCTQHRIEHASIRQVVSQNFRVWLTTRKPDHVLENRAAAGPSVGSMKGVSFGTNTDREREDEYLAHFFKEIDNGVNTLLRNDTAPLLLAGTEDEIAIYRRVPIENSLPNRGSFAPQTRGVSVARAPYFDRDGITLYHGDCRGILPELPSGSFDMVLTDPPYLVSYTGRWGDEPEEIAGDSDPSWVEPVFRELWRVLKPDSLCLSFYGWPHADFFLSTWKAVGFRPVSLMTFVKNRWGLGYYTRSRHEPAYLLAKGCPPRPSSAISDVFEWMRPEVQLHPNQKPLGAIEQILAAYTPDDAVVIDPFSGSGTTLVAARRTGRRALGIEIKAEYCEVVAVRLAQDVVPLAYTRPQAVQLEFDAWLA